jgi:protein phosphatase
MKLRFEVAYSSAQGDRRQQEDSCGFAVLDAAVATRSPDGNLEGSDAILSLVAALADGMGGHVAGERASRIVCTHFIEACLELDRQKESNLAPADRLGVALDRANTAIAQTVATEPNLDGMGSTLIGALVDMRGLRWISVGDSHLFLYRDTELFALNQDHSLAPVLDQLAESGRITAEEALNHPHRHHLRSALTGGEIELIDLFGEPPFALEPGDWIVLASDGIDSLEPDEIAKLILKNSTGGSQALAEALVSAVQDRKVAHQDNTTVMTLAVLAADTSSAS